MSAHQRPTGNDHFFPFEKLDVYQLAVSVARWASQQSFPSHRRHLRDQLVRAADSMVLNIAEGAGFPPGNQRRNHHRIARGSAAECLAVLDISDLDQAPQRRDDLRRIGAMLAQMTAR